MMYIVMLVQKTLKIKLGGAFDSEIEIPFSFAKGVIGAVPVFKYKKDAKKYLKEGNRKCGGIFKVMVPPTLNTPEAV